MEASDVRDEIAILRAKIDMIFDSLKEATLAMADLEERVTLLERTDVSSEAKKERK